MLFSSKQLNKKGWVYYGQKIRNKNLKATLDG